jgi:hypothetical protein
MADFYVYRGPTLGVVLASTSSATETVRCTGGATLGPAYVAELPSGYLFIKNDGPTNGLIYSA